MAVNNFKEKSNKDKKFIEKIHSFSERWKDKGDEKSETQKFWLEILRDVCGIEQPESLIEFEKRVRLEHKSFIDGYIAETRAIIEQKSLDINLDKAAKQSDGTFKTPFEQAKRYSDWLPDSQRARWIIVCNFKEFHIHDMEYPRDAPIIIKLENLDKEYKKLQFLADKKAPTPKEIREVEISVKAGELVGKLYDALHSQYANPDDKNSLRSLNILCVRIVFLLYAEDAGLFAKSAFRNYLASHKDSARYALIELFRVLSQKDEERDPYLDDDLKNFPYVNGGLFQEQGIEIPKLDDNTLEIILNKMSDGFDWSGINPTIFGAVFESTLNPDTRRSGGMHYTSIENIHKVIDPLFLDNLKSEINDVLNMSSNGTREKNARNKKLLEFQEELANLTFLDPACGSGNFLTETFLSLRELENKIIAELTHGQRIFAEGEFSPVKVSIGNFYGIEINDFAVAVARTALWIAEYQMIQKTHEIIDFHDDYLPLKTYNNIIEGNALKLDWNYVVPRKKLNYIMGNPPFVGYSLQTREQKEEILSVYVDENGEPYKNAGKIDYVAGWYFKAAEFIMETKIKCAFVSTNSITQGEQAAGVWKPLFERFKIHFDFAWRTFKWVNEGVEQAQVYIVIIGFSCAKNDEPKRIYMSNNSYIAENINQYLVDAETVFIGTRKTPLCNVPEMITGNRPADGGHLLLNSDEYQELIEKEPKSKKYIKRFMMGDEFINGKIRYCLWLVDVSPAELRSMPMVMERVKACREDRLQGAPDRQKLANTPWLFRETLNPEHYLAVPVVSSENRFYIPIGWLDNSVIPGNNLRILPDATLYHFGILTSRVHMAWMRAVCGRLKSDYSYSNTIVYNNFPWPSPSDKQRAKIEQTAQEILNARAKYPDSSLADLYDDTTMPQELRKAHKANDTAVCAAYGFDKDIDETEIVAKLMRMYQELIKGEK